jgi:hypothetical protein
MLALARELWVVKDRQRVMEELLAASGHLPAGAIDACEPSADAQAGIDRECRMFVDGLMEAMQREAIP